MASSCSYLLAVLVESPKGYHCVTLILLLFIACFQNPVIKILSSWWVCFLPFPFACHLELGGVCIIK